jgi:hypothetical protein
MYLNTYRPDVSVLPECSVPGARHVAQNPVELHVDLLAGLRTGDHDVGHATGVMIGNLWPMS